MELRTRPPLSRRDPAADGRKTLVLVNPVNPARTGLTVNRSSRFPPLGLGIVAALTPDRYRVVLVDEVVAPFRLEEADLVGITAFTSSVSRAYEIAALYRQRGTPVVLGGIHASMCPDEALRFVDAVVVGEAERAWPEVLRDFEAGRLQRLYRGETGSLAGLPVPRRELFSPEYLFASVQTSRGCPMDCPFCSVTSFNGRTFRQRPVEEVLDELAGIEQPFVFFVDDNLLGHGKEAEARAIALFRGMVERGLRKSWFCQASIDFARNEEVLAWAARSGCKMVFIGLESEHPDELRAMGKKLNLHASYAEAFRRIHRHGIAVLGAFIFGSDAETPETMERKARFMLRAPVDVLQTTVLTPLPGTRLFEQLRAEGRLLHAPGPEAWPRFDMTELTFRPRRMNAQEFQRAHDRQQGRIYSRWTLARKFLQTLASTRRLETALWALGSNRNYRAVARGLSAGRP
jgi:radical SAM superfamily enzyme YgiQ (UPF0313 family)